ncbi:MAG: hypothetical protein H6679_04760 [Epsilonproteobacteria bacterium]|nr:hypothetical protein [Campylobacterota bacterium]
MLQRLRYNILFCSLALLAGGISAQTMPAQIHVDQANKDLSQYFYKLKQRYNLVMTQEAVQKHIRKIDEIVHHTAGQDMYIRSTTLVPLKKQLKEYLKFMYPDQFRLTASSQGFFSRGIARKRIKAELMHYLENQLSIADKDHRQALYQQVKQNIIRPQLTSLSLAENGQVTISGKNVETILDLARKELSNVLVPNFTKTQYSKQASKKGRSQKGRLLGLFRH